MIRERLGLRSRQALRRALRAADFVVGCAVLYDVVTNGRWVYITIGLALIAATVALDRFGLEVGPGEPSAAELRRSVQTKALERRH